MPICAVFSCKNKSTTSSLKKDGISFHLFPKDDAFKTVWKNACNRHPSWTPTRTSSVCSKHFEKAQFLKLPNNRRRLVDHAIPTLHLTESETNFNGKAAVVMIRIDDSVVQTHQELNIAADSPEVTDVQSPKRKSDSTTNSGELIPKREILDDNIMSESQRTLIPDVKLQEITPSNMKLINKIKLQAIKIKRLQSKTRYLQKKVTSLENIIKELEQEIN